MNSMFMLLCHSDVTTQSVNRIIGERVCLSPFNLNPTDDILIFKNVIEQTNKQNKDIKETPDNYYDSKMDNGNKIQK